jgi:hypothetical protein
MENEVTKNNGVSIILDYILKKYSWRESYFRHFSNGQKILFFLPIIFLNLPIYGTYELFYHHSWFLFISFGVLMLFSIWWFFKQKTYFEQKVFSRLYLSVDCKTITNFHKQRLSELLGLQNTSENRSSWISYFKSRKSAKKPFIGIVFVFGFIYMILFIKPHDKEFFTFIKIVMHSLPLILMNIAFVMPAFTNFKFKFPLHNQAYKLVLELDKE